jgi:hypothetical protein
MREIFEDIFAEGGFILRLQQIGKRRIEPVLDPIHFELQSVILTLDSALKPLLVNAQGLHLSCEATQFLLGLVSFVSRVLRGLLGQAPPKLSILDLALKLLHPLEDELVGLREACVLISLRCRCSGLQC